MDHVPLVVRGSRMGQTRNGSMGMKFLLTRYGHACCNAHAGVPDAGLPRTAAATGHGKLEPRVSCEGIPCPTLLLSD